MAPRKQKSPAGTPERQSTDVGGAPSAVDPYGDRVEPSVQNDLGPVVVGMGASAGGLDAFKQFFAAMPGDSGLAFVLIQHLDPTHVSMTAELLARQTTMPVVQVEQQALLEPNRVYVIPPNCYLTIEGNRLHLSGPVERRGVRVPIDIFFRSLAAARGRRAIGVILSGTGSDGTLGAVEIKAAGGMVLVQSPQTASFDGMPRSAIEAGAVDGELAVEVMPERILAHVGHSSFDADSTFADRVVSNVSDASEFSPTPQRKAPSPDELSTVIGLLRARMKYDFSCYKKGTLTRRIQRRMGLRQVEGIGDYVKLLRDEQDEVTALFKDLLIGVTNFFREASSWETLREQVLRPLIAAAAEKHRPVDSPHAPLRAWVPGCATGEEPYSLAMLLNETMQSMGTTVDTTIFASDIDRDSLAIARTGVFPDTITTDVSVERLQRFFSKGERNYRIKQDIRELVVFAEQNVTSDPPFSRLDLVSCRNLLIYLEPAIQKKILATFHFALREGGYLFLGNAETITQQHDLFVPISRKSRIYQRVGNTPRRGLAASTNFIIPSSSPIEAIPNATQRKAVRLPASAQQIVLQRFAPACALVTRTMEVRYLHGPVDEYLQLPSGEQTHDLIAMARQGLRTKLRLAVQRAISENKPITLEDVRVRRGHEYFPVRVTIEPLQQPDDLAGLLLLAFDEATAENRVRLIYVEPAEPPPPDEPESSAEYRTVIRQLERELSETREDLQTSIEEFETSNEEFKAANEEVTSINEELQSTNEELETSKEELQSMNEELQTVNYQLESKVGELVAVNNDLNNLLGSIDHATLFLDRKFCVKRFTPATAQLMRVIDTDIGRPFSDFAKDFTDDELLSDSQRVLKHLAPIEKEVPGAHGSWLSRRIVPYRTEDDRIDGVVITFTDVTERRRAREVMHAMNETLELRVNAQTQLLRLVHEITAYANQAQAIDDALRYAVQKICQFGDWDVGYAYRVAADGENAIVPSGIWYEKPGLDTEVLRKRITASPYTALDTSTISEVVRTGATQWRGDAPTPCEPISSQLGELGVRSLFAFPVVIVRQVRAILTFYSLQSVSSEDAFDAAMLNVGTQLGHVIERNLSERRLAEAALQERERLGQELHDSVGQQLSALGMLVASLGDDIPGKSASTSSLLEKLRVQIEKSQTQVRSLLNGLLSVDVDGGGLWMSLMRLAEETQALYSIDCRCDCPQQIDCIDRFKATQLYLIANEAVHNAAKHAHANKISITLTIRPSVELAIADDGAGLPDDIDASLGMGVPIMRHRASVMNATLTMESAPNGGTIVRCHLPA